MQDGAHLDGLVLNNLEINNNYNYNNNKCNSISFLLTVSLSHSLCVCLRESVRNLFSSPVGWVTRSCCSLSSCMRGMGGSKKMKVGLLIQVDFY